MGDNPAHRADDHAGAECRIFSRKQVASAGEEGAQVESSLGGGRGCETRSLHLFHQSPRVTRWRLILPSLGD
jgi:hypothetical protein